MTIAKAGAPRRLTALKRSGNEAVLGGGVWHLGGHHGPAVERSHSGDDHDGRHDVAPRRSAEHRVDDGGIGGARVSQLGGRQDPEDGDQRQHVDHRAREGPEHGRAGDVAIGVADLRRRDGRRLDAQIAEQGDGHAAADRVDRALAAHVPRGVVAAVDVEQPHDRHERQRAELQDRGRDLHGAHVLDPAEVDERGNPEAGEDEEDRPQLLVARVDEDLDIEDPADRDGGVARPPGDPVRPGAHEPVPVAEGETRIRVGTAFRRHAACQRREDHPEREGADGREGHRDDRDRPVSPQAPSAG